MPSSKGCAQSAGAASRQLDRPSVCNVQRVLVIGNTGAGKSTLASTLSDRLGAPHVEMDALWWQAGWTASDPEVFRQRLRAATAAEKWVVCGNYHSHAFDVVWPRADTIVWLDHPLGIVIVRLLRRTLRRIRRREQLWNGNVERWGALFARDSLLVWALKSHGKHRSRYPSLFAAPDTAHATTVRLRSPRAVNRWLADVS